MLAENVFPPIPSEVILPLAGYTAAQGRGSLWVVAIAGTLGSAAGAVLWYYVGRWIGIERLKRFASRHGRWLTLTPGEVNHVDRWFDRYGRWAVLFGRMVPGVRTLISVPAGRSEEHTSELQSLMRISYAVFCLKKKKPLQSLRHCMPLHSDKHVATKH